jgi:hypothetical protein
MVRTAIVLYKIADEWHGDEALFTLFDLSLFVLGQAVLGDECTGAFRLFNKKGILAIIWHIGIYSNAW